MTKRKYFMILTLLIAGVLFLYYSGIVTDVMAKVDDEVSEVEQEDIEFEDKSLERANTGLTSNKLKSQSKKPELQFETFPPSESEVGSQIVISWETGDPEAQYRFKLDVPGDWMFGLGYAMNKWSDWGNTQRVMYDDFVLGGGYDFTVEARVEEGPKSRISNKFKLNFVMPEILDKGIKIDWKKVRQAKSESEKYTILANEYKDAYKTWIKLYEKRRRVLKASLSGDDLVRTISEAITDGSKDLLLKAAKVEMPATLNKLLAPKTLYDIVKQAGIDLVLVYRNKQTNEAAFKAAASYWAWKGYELIANNENVTDKDIVSTMRIAKKPTEKKRENKITNQAFVPQYSHINKGDLVVFNKLDKGELAGFSVGMTLSQVKNISNVLETKNDKIDGKDAIAITVTNTHPYVHNYKLDIVNQGLTGNPADGFSPWSYGEYKISKVPPKLGLFFNKGNLDNDLWVIGGMFLIVNLDMMQYNGKSNGKLKDDVKKKADDLAEIYLKKYPFLLKKSHYLHRYPVLEGKNGNIHLNIEIIPQKNSQVIAIKKL